MKYLEISVSLVNHSWKINQEFGLTWAVILGLVNVSPCQSNPVELGSSISDEFLWMLMNIFTNLFPSSSWSSVSASVRGQPGGWCTTGDIRSLP